MNAALTPRRQRLCDLWAKTIVVSKGPCKQMWPSLLVRPTASNSTVADRVPVVAGGDLHLRFRGQSAELNPVRAGLVAHPEAWAWSSAAAHSGTAPPEVGVDMDLLQKHWTSVA